MTQKLKEVEQFVEGSAVEEFVRARLEEVRNPTGLEGGDARLRAMSLRIPLIWIFVLEKIASRLEMSRTACAEKLLISAIEDATHTLGIPAEDIVIGGDEWKAWAKQQKDQAA